MAGAGPVIGLRSEAEIRHVSRLREDAAIPPVSENEVALLEAILKVRETSDNALEQLRDIAVDMPAIKGAVERLARRLDALEARGMCRPEHWISKPATVAPRWNITTVSSLASMPKTAPTCRRWPPAGAMMR